MIEGSLHRHCGSAWCIIIYNRMTRRLIHYHVIILEFPSATAALGARINVGPYIPARLHLTHARNQRLFSSLDLGFCRDDCKRSFMCYLGFRLIYHFSCNQLHNTNDGHICQPLFSFLAESTALPIRKYQKETYSIECTPPREVRTHQRRPGTRLNS